MDAQVQSTDAQISPNCRGVRIDVGSRPGDARPPATAAMLDAGSRYLRAVGPFYGLFGLGMALYFASQGAGRVLRALLANLARRAIATVGAWLALQSSGKLSHVFLAMSAALAAFGLINAAAVAGGAWFGPIRWPVLRRAYAVVRD